MFCDAYVGLGSSSNLMIVSIIRVQSCDERLRVARGSVERFSKVLSTSLDSIFVQMGPSYGRQKGWRI